ncbi:hypothetical protein HYU17_01980 [Candidatus Woesearchaeota archaeon]|nr:hypothetical protein [Candidatus Woesearchaeota archaeon]
MPPYELVSEVPRHLLEEVINGKYSTELTTAEKAVLESVPPPMQQWFKQAVNDFYLPLRSVVRQDTIGNHHSKLSFLETLVAELLPATAYEGSKGAHVKNMRARYEKKQSIAPSSSLHRRPGKSFDDALPAALQAYKKIVVTNLGIHLKRNLPFSYLSPSSVLHGIEGRLPG